MTGVMESTPQVLISHTTHPQPLQAACYSVLYLYFTCTLLCEEAQVVGKRLTGDNNVRYSQCIPRFNNSEIIFVYQVRKVSKSLNLCEPIYCRCRIKDWDYIGFFLVLQHCNYISWHDHPTHWFSQKQKTVLEYMMMNYIYLQEILTQIIFKAFMKCFRLNRGQSLRVRRT